MEKVELLELKQQVEDAKMQVSKLEGQREGLLEQLKKDFFCKTLAEAQKKEKELKEEIENLEEEIEEASLVLKEKYDLNGTRSKKST
jgi:C4-type Zn-finger protein